MSWKAHIGCRACGTGTLVQYLDLGTQAPANALRRSLDEPEFTAPLTVAWCTTCGLSQLEQVIPPEILYTNYPFRAGTSRMWREHCTNLVQSRTGPGFWVDIGANDGTLLREAQGRGWTVLGVDPDPATDTVPMLADCWDHNVGKGIAQFHGEADVVTATNVFGHVDDAMGFLLGLRDVLKKDGVAIIECPHLLPFLEDTAFDTVYHEHLSYWSLRPLEILAEGCGLGVVDCQSFPKLHGGTMRYTLMRDEGESPVGHRFESWRHVAALRVLENALTKDGIMPYREFADRTAYNIHLFRDVLEREQGRLVVGYGASAKGHVLLQAAGIQNTLIQYLVDDTPEKWGYYAPGTDIPIQAPANLDDVDVLVLLSWNNAPELRQKAIARGFRGKFLTPHPSPMLEAA